MSPSTGHARLQYSYQASNGLYLGTVCMYVCTSLEEAIRGAKTGNLGDEQMSTNAMHGKFSFLLFI